MVQQATTIQAGTYAVKSFDLDGVKTSAAGLGEFILYQVPAKPTGEHIIQLRNSFPVRFQFAQSFNRATGADATGNYTIKYGGRLIWEAVAFENGFQGVAHAVLPENAQIAVQSEDANAGVDIVVRRIALEIVKL